MADKTTEAKTVRDIFENMDYGSITENLDLAQAWLKQHELNIPNTLDEILSAIKTEDKSHAWLHLSGGEKTKLLNRLAAEIERHATLLCQLELLARQILIKDTKLKSIPIVTDYLRYYAGYACQIDNYFPGYVPYGLCLFCLERKTPLTVLGASLASALATGNSIIFSVPPIELPVICLIQELCKNIGFPDGAITVISNSHVDALLKHEKIKKITYMGNLSDKIINETEILEDKHLTTLHLGKSTSIIFDTADLDSACDNIIDSAWSYSGMFPCGINKLFVQETIFNEFVDKIKLKISKLNVTSSNTNQDKTTDIIFNSGEILTDKIEFINQLPIQIGFKHFGNNVISDEQNTDVLSILSFRTANEAIALANHSRFALAVSLWSENISLITEVTAKIQASIIWINNHGYLNSNASFSPLKESGFGYFGGEEGIFEYLKCKKPVKFQVEKAQHTTKIENNLPAPLNKKRTYLYYAGAFKKSESGLTDGDNEFPNKKDVRNIVECANKSYETWNKLRPKNRSQILWKLAENSETLTTNNTKLKEKWIEYLHNWSIRCNNNTTLTQIDNPQLKIVKESLGVLAIELYNDTDFTCYNLILAAIAFGNSIIIINHCESAQEFLDEICKILPSSGITSGVINIIYGANNDVIDTLKSHRELKIYYKLSTIKLTCFKRMKKVQLLDYANMNSYKNILKLVTYNKCIWTCTGVSFL